HRDLMFFFSSRRRHTRWPRDWSSDVCSSDLSCQEYRSSVVVLEVQEPTLLRYSWQDDGGGETTEVIYRLEPHAGGTRFTYDHTRSEERRVGKSVNLDGRRNSEKKIDNES